MITEKQMKDKLSYTDYLKTSEEERYELINGELIGITSPTVKHQRLLFELSIILRDFIKNKNIGEILIAPCDVIFDDFTVLQPDILFISNNNLDIIKDRIYGSPDLVVEIISQSSFVSDSHEKFKLYEKFGVKEYWLIDPNYKVMEIFSLENNRFELFDKATETGNVKSKLIKDLSIDLDKLMGVISL